jgi:hypothetical protein
VPAQKAVWIASSATDGKSGLLIDQFSPWVMLEGALRELLRAAFRRPFYGPDIKMTVVQPYRR